MPFFRAIPKVSQEGDTKKGTKIAPIAEEILNICGDELLGYWEIPEEREDALAFMSERVFLPKASYGNGQNRRNGFYPDLDEAIFEKGRRILLSAIEDDARKPTVMTTLISVRP